MVSVAGQAQADMAFFEQISQPGGSDVYLLSVPDEVAAPTKSLPPKYATQVTLTQKLVHVGMLRELRHSISTNGDHDCSRTPASRKSARLLETPVQSVTWTDEAAALHPRRPLSPSASQVSTIPQPHAALAFASPTHHRHALS